EHGPIAGTRNSRLRVNLNDMPCSGGESVHSPAILPAPSYCPQARAGLISELTMRPCDLEYEAPQRSAILVRNRAAKTDSWIVAETGGPKGFGPPRAPAYWSRLTEVINSNCRD